MEEEGTVFQHITPTEISAFWKTAQWCEHREDSVDELWTLTCVEINTDLQQVEFALGQLYRRYGDEDRACLKNKQKQKKN